MSLNIVAKGVKLVITIRKSHSLISGEAKEPGRIKIRTIGAQLDLLLQRNTWKSLLVRIAHLGSRKTWLDHP